MYASYKIRNIALFRLLRGPVTSYSFRSALYLFHCCRLAGLIDGKASIDLVRVGLQTASQIANNHTGVGGQFAAQLHHSVLRVVASVTDANHCKRQRIAFGLSRLTGSILSIILSFVYEHGALTTDRVRLEIF